MGIGLYMRRLVPRFSRGAGEFAFLGQQGHYPYPGPGNVGFSQQRALRVITGVTVPSYSVNDLVFVTPSAPGPFHSDLTGKTSPMISGAFYNVKTQPYDDNQTSISEPFE